MLSPQDFIYPFERDDIPSYLSIKSLRQELKENKIKGYSKLKKMELIEKCIKNNICLYSIYKRDYDFGQEFANVLNNNRTR